MLAACSALSFYLGLICSLTNLSRSFDHEQKILFPLIAVHYCCKYVTSKLRKRAVAWSLFVMPWTCKPVLTLSREVIFNSSLLWKLVKRLLRATCFFYVCRRFQLHGFHKCRPFVCTQRRKHCCEAMPSIAKGSPCHGEQMSLPRLQTKQNN